MQLTHRQTEILQLVAKGKTTQEIASELSISDVTVKWHIKSAMQQLGAASRAEAVAIGIRHGLL